MPDMHQTAHEKGKYVLYSVGVEEVNRLPVAQEGYDNISRVWHMGGFWWKLA